MWEGGRPVEYPSFTGEEHFAFAEPYGEQEVHLVPHPEPVTVPRTIDVRNVVFKVGYPSDETVRTAAPILPISPPLRFDGRSMALDQPSEESACSAAAAPSQRKVHSSASGRVSANTIGISGYRTWTRASMSGRNPAGV